MHYINWIAENNPAGLLTVECCPLTLYNEKSQEVAIADLNLSLADRWLTLYATVNTKGYTETEIEEVHGNRYEVQLSGFYPGDSADIRRRFEYMRWHRWVVRSRDNMGVRRQAGDRENGMSFISNFQVDAVMSGDRGYRFEFFGELPVRPMVV